jgi:putative lipoic acid-binding regulatory protein
MEQNSLNDKAIYPCLLPIKIIGKNTLRFAAVMDAMVVELVDADNRLKVERMESKAGTYASMTIHVSIRDRRHMDDVFLHLQSLEDVVMVL